MRHPFTRSVAAGLLIVAGGAFATACDDTADGILEDTQENVDELDQELEEITPDGT